MGQKQTGQIKRPRFTAMERLDIETGLNVGESATQIARRNGRDVRTITREITSRMIVDNKVLRGKYNNRCIHSNSCEKTDACQNCFDSHPAKCRNCFRCNMACKEFVEKICPKLLRSPYVCNGCKEIATCVLSKRFYRSSIAHDKYLALLSESRKGANLSEEDMIFLDERLTDWVKNQGKSIYSFAVYYAESFDISVKTLYNYVNQGTLRLKRGDMPRSCKLKKRHGVPQPVKADKLCFFERTRSEYLDFLARHPGTGVVEMDTVEGVKGGKVLLTLMFMPYQFMAALLLERKTSQCVTDAFEDIFDRIKLYCLRNSLDCVEVFKRLFPVLLTDRGSEFTNPRKIENLCDIENMVNIFYCDPCASYQKSHAERNHGNIRKVLPKGNHYLKATSFDLLTQADVSHMMSHINSYPRQVNNDATPYDSFAKAFPVSFIEEVFGIVRIDMPDVVLLPSLLGIKQEVKSNIQ